MIGTYGPNVDIPLLAFPYMERPEIRCRCAHDLRLLFDIVDIPSPVDEGVKRINEHVVSDVPRFCVLDTLQNVTDFIPCVRVRILCLGPCICYKRQQHL